VNRCAIYARFSNEDRQNARSIPDQHAVCAERAKARGWAIVAGFDDAGISGFAMANRPGLLAAIAAAGRGEFDILLVEDEDRLARNLGHLATIRDDLNACGVTLATLGTDEVDLMRTAFKGLIGQQYLIDLGQKTSRGMRSNAEKGLATGSRLFGYRTAPGGEQVIVEQEAEIVRRICTLFADYDMSGREIADLLNRERAPGPRGGFWNGSSISGSAARGNGVLHSEIYAGAKVWNRMEVRKDPRTGKRTPVMRQPSEWRRTSVEHLRIVPQDLWDRVQARHAANAARGAGAADPQRAARALGNRRKPGLFSGLLKCGACGSSYTAFGGGKLVCAGNRERGSSFCQNSRKVLRAEVEARALEGLQTRLLAPAAVAAYVRAYHAAWQRLDRERLAERQPLERRRAELTRRIGRVVDAICDGTATADAKARALEFEAERDAIDRQLAQAPAEPPIALHPGAADAYAKIVGELRQALADYGEAASTVPANRRLIDVARGLVTKIEIIPNPRGKGGLDLRLHGDLSRFLAGEDGSPEASTWGSRLVAGGRYKPAPPMIVAFPLVAEAA
jgi:DNA invertase Pin-like site-specific DNA recombinase